MRNLLSFKVSMNFGSLYYRIWSRAGSYYLTTELLSSLYAYERVTHKFRSATEALRTATDLSVFGGM